jgi:hypothetical protein
VDVDRERAFRLDEDRPARDARELAGALIDAAASAERGR